MLLLLNYFGIDLCLCDNDEDFLTLQTVVMWYMILLPLLYDIILLYLLNSLDVMRQ